MTQKPTYQELEKKLQIQQEINTKLQQEHHDTLEGLLVGVVVHDADSKVLMANKEACRLLGLSLEQMQGKEVSDPNWKFVKEDLTKIEVSEFPISQVMATKKPIANYTLGIVRSDKDFPRWVDVTAKPILSEDGAVLKVVVNFIDISARIKTEEEVRRSEVLQHKMVSNTRDILFIVNDSGIITYKSPNVENLFGWIPEELIGKSVWENIHPEDIKKAIQVFEKLLGEKKTSVTFECRYKCKDGAYRWIEYTGHNLLDDDDINGILGSYHDIADRKTAELSLVESEARFKVLYNATFGGIAIHDQGVIIDCNQGFATMTGYSIEELRGMNGFRLLDEETRENVIENMKKNVEVPYEGFLIRKNGEKFPIRMEGKNVPYKGKIIRSTEFRDITERKQKEKERKELEGQLAQAQKIESIGQLAGGVAHDFNNMLSVIIGYSELTMLSLDRSLPIYKNLTQIHDAAKKSAEITKQLLAFARKQTVSPKVIDLNEIIESMLKLLRRLINEDIDIVWLPGDNIGSIKVDPSQIDQILANLLVNASDAIENGGKIIIETRNSLFDNEYCKNFPDVDAGDYVMLSVSDDGCGISPEVQEKLFEPFFTTKALHEGTGLGLSTVYGIMKQNSGTINVYSEPERGSTFNLYFPRHSGPLDELSATPVNLSKLKGTETILVVEDETAIMTIVKMMLEELGYNIFLANSPQEAIVLCQSSSPKFHLLITDVIMPEMNGRDLASTLCEIIPGLKCLYMSGYTADTIAHHGVLDEQVHFIQKPFAKHDLAVAVKSALS